MNKEETKDKKESKNRKQLVGIVTSDKMDKTVVVEASSFGKHPKYGKFIKKDKKYKAHDENNEYKEGDKVLIEEMKPMSKDKKFRVIEKK